MHRLSLHDLDDWIEVLRQDASAETISDQLYRVMQRTAQTYLENHTNDPIFQVGLGRTKKERDSISNTFIDHLPTDWRQTIQCSACRKFMRDWGTLVCVDPMTGDLIPLFWDPNGDVPPLFKESVKAVADLLKQNLISSQCRSTPGEGVVGVVKSGGFTHMHFDFNGYLEKRDKEKSIASLRPASMSELVEMLDRILKDNNKGTVDHTAYLLLEDKLPYSDKHKGAIRWLQGLYEPDLFSGQSEVSRHNLLCYFAAKTFIGCINTLRNGMVNELLDMVRSGMDFEEIREKWTRLASPTKYMRPIAAPTAGNIAAAEKLFAELKLTENDMRRAYLKPDQIPSSAFLYRSPLSVPTKAGIFSAVVSKPKSFTTYNKTESRIPEASITFTKFVNEILPTAQEIKYQLPTHSHVFFFITGLPNTAPLLQWHTSTNLASWYVNPVAKAVTKHNLSAGWIRVPYIVSFPHMWTELPSSSSDPPTTADESSRPIVGKLPSSDALDSFKHKQHGISYLVRLEGATDSSSSLCLFPTMLRSEMHGVRATIEAYSKRGEVERAKDENGKDCFVGGVKVGKVKGKEMNHVFRVEDQRGRVEMYKVVLFE